MFFESKFLSYLLLRYTGGEIVRVGIIADDLTGANDTGVQFARKGLHTSVLMSENDAIQSDLDVLVIDTDSRDLAPNDAYIRVKSACEFIKKLNPEIIYKKLDSTMRGNIATELDAVFDTFKPDFVIIAPGYPKNNRIVENGVIYIHEKPLHETEFAYDPKSPITDSHIVEILKKETKHKIEIISKDDIELGADFIVQKLAVYHKNETPYLVFDSVSEDDLAKIVNVVQATDYQVVWSGSAGLANYVLNDDIARSNEVNKALPKSDHPVLMVIGSVNKNSRTQLEIVLSEAGVKGVMLHSHQVIGDQTSSEKEIARVIHEVEKAIKNKEHIVLYSSGNQEEIKLANKMGESLSLTPKMVSEKISEVLGELTAKILKDYEIERLFLTGGDTAKKVCAAMGIVELKLMEEVEIGIPIGTLVHEREIVTITKAGGFGSEQSLIKSLEILKGDTIKCAQSLV